MTTGGGGGGGGVTIGFVSGFGLGFSRGGDFSLTGGGAGFTVGFWMTGGGSGWYLAQVRVNTNESCFSSILPLFTFFKIFSKIKKKI